MADHLFAYMLVVEADDQETADEIARSAVSVNHPGVAALGALDSVIDIPEPATQE